MATYTSNINLKKPAQSDKIRIADFNGNADNIDAAIGADFGQGTKPSINQAINSLADGLAIIASGNVHAAITAGQFVYVRNHDTLSEGLYVASSNISENGTLSGSNLTADGSGGLNALKSKLGSSYAPVTLASGITGTVYIMRMGNLRVLSGYVNPNTSGASITIATLDTSDRPPLGIRGSFSGYSVTATGEFLLNSNGVFELAINATPGNTVKFNITYAVE